jgi:6-phosphogluconolactonase (cycloisomerase 2 family)
MATARNGQLLFVVNDGKRDNTITSFRATRDGLKRVQTVSSGGTLPVSLAVSDHLLYVVNERSASIFGYRISNSGHLWPVPNSERQLSQQFPSQPNAKGGVAAQIGFSPDGRHLVVTERGLPSHQGVIDTFEVQPDGSTSEAQEFTNGVDPNPFGFSFTSGGQLLVSNVGFVGPDVNYPEGNPPFAQLGDPTQFKGSASSYNLSSTGSLAPVSTEVASGGRGACWLVLSQDQQYAYVTNTLSAAAPGSGIGALTTYKVGPGGTLTYVRQTNTTPGGNPSDMAVSPDGKYLYMLNPGVFGPPSGIDVFKIGSGGSLTLQPGSVAGLPTGASGLAVS